MNTQGNSTQGTSKSEQAKQLAEQMSKFKTVEAAKAWWHAKSPSQKGAIVGIMIGCGMGGYAFFATYKAYGIGAGIWSFILHGSVAGACATSIATASYTPKNYNKAKSGLDAL
jgi:hypothetical protein